MIAVKYNLFDVKSDVYCIMDNGEVVRGTISSDPEEFVKTVTQYCNFYEQDTLRLQAPEFMFDELASGIRKQEAELYKTQNLKIERI